MNRIQWLAVCGLILFAGLLCDQPDAPPALPEAKLSGGIMPGGEIRIDISVPDRHHAYLDAGREGHLIPVSFDWELPGQPENPKAKSTPFGEMHEEAGARVLRGSGRWVFLPASPVEAGTVKIRTQICDEIKGICFPPKKAPLSLGKIDA